MGTRGEGNKAAAMEATKKTEFVSRKFDMPLSIIEWATLKDSPRKRALKENYMERKKKGKR